MSEKKILSAADILGAEDLEIREVEITGWPGTLRLKAFTAAECNKYLERTSGAASKSALAIILCMAAVDENGNRMFQDNQLEVIKSKSFKALKEVQDVVLDMNGFGTDGKAKKPTTEEEAKND